MKSQQDPVALEDDQYPPWLWNALAESKEKSAKDDKEGDLFGKSFSSSYASAFKANNW